MGCDHGLRGCVKITALFQSTQPEWAATGAGGSFLRSRRYFNPRSPSGLRHSCQYQKDRQKQFQSTQPEWAATRCSSPAPCAIKISIHAARVGCDKRFLRTIYRSEYFNPRSPSGLRHARACVLPQVTFDFNPRSPSGLRHN